MPNSVFPYKTRERERGVREGREKGGEREGLLGFILVSKTKTSSSNFKVRFNFFIFDE